MDKYDGFKYRFSTGEIEYADGTRRKICSVCGKECKSNAGFDYSYELDGSYGFQRAGLCRSCAKKAKPAFDELFDRLNEIFPPKSYGDIAKAIERSLGMREWENNNGE